MHTRLLQRSRRLVLAGALVSLVFPVVALAGYTYAGPKTWLNGWSAHTGYDNSANRWHYNNFHAPSTGYLKRVVFINSSGGWQVEQHDSFEDTYIDLNAPGYTVNWQKKAYCESMNPSSFVGDCYADAEPP